MKPVKLQLALFFRNTLDRPDEKYSSLNKKMNNLFNAPPTILPLPDDAPSNIPMVQLSSEDKKYNANISKKRADLFLNPNPEDGNLDSILKDFHIKSENFIDFFVNFCRINRMGFISDNFISEINSIKKINDKYFKKDLSKSIELKIRFNERDSSHGVEYNHITEISNVTANIDNSKKEGILIHKDLNNVQINNYFNKNDLMKLFENFSKNLSNEKIRELI